MKIPFSPPYIDDSVISEVVDSLKSGWITTGPKVKALEEEIGKLSGAQRVLCVNSWTSGAILVLRWLGLKPGDEVIVPAYTYSATAMAVLWAGGKPVMVDSGEDFNISVEAIRRAVTPRTKAIIPVDIAGFPCDYKSIMALVEEPEIRVCLQQRLTCSSSWDAYWCLAILPILSEHTMKAAALVRRPTLPCSLCTR